eukprot:scaffold647929_cov33-Prasinocladus_malaysianus.AAC.2
MRVLCVYRVLIASSHRLDANLPSSSQDAYDKYLVVTFVGETRVLALNADEELEEDEIEGFDAAAQTLNCCNVVHDQLVQVTRGGVRLVDAASGKLRAQWAPEDGRQVRSASTTHDDQMSLMPPSRPAAGS